MSQHTSPDLDPAGRPGRQRIWHRGGTTRRWVTALAVLGMAAAAAVVPLGAPSAAAASGAGGALRLAVTKVAAGTPGAALGWTYTAAGAATTGTIGIDVPAAFGVPQATSATSPGYVSTSSGCAQFQVTAITTQPDGSSLLTIAVQCAGRQAGTISWSGVAVPTRSGGYVFAATFTPTGSAAVPFTQANTIIVTPGPLARLALSPASAIIAPGAAQAYTARGYDAYGNPLGNLTATTQFSIARNGSCTGSSCTATSLGKHTVTATNDGVQQTATLFVAEADLSAAQTVSTTTPFYYAPVTFTTTVTNTSTQFTSHGVTATVNEPAGLISPAATPSTGTYNPGTGTWAIGSLAPGATATLTITGDAQDVTDGTQTVTATVTATTYDPNQANNTASASEASQPPPVEAFITPDPNNDNPVNVCDTGTVTFYASTGNAANPAAPPSSAGNVTYVWSCQTMGTPCPTPDNNTTDSPFVTYTDSGFTPGQTYAIVLSVVPDDQTQYRVTANTTYYFGATCIP